MTTQAPMSSTERRRFILYIAVTVIIATALGGGPEARRCRMAKNLRVRKRLCTGGGACGLPGERPAYAAASMRRQSRVTV